MAANFFSNMGNRFGGMRTNRANGSGGLQSPTGSNMPGNIAPPPPPPEYPKFFFQEKYSRLGVKGNFMPLAAQPKNVDLGDWLAHQAVEQYHLVERLIICIQEVDQKTGLPICNPRSCPVMSAGRSHTYTWLNSAKEPVKVPAAQYINLVQRWIVGKISDNKVFPTDPVGAGRATAFASGEINSAHANQPIPAGPTNLNVSMDQLAGRDWVGKSTSFPENFFTDCRTIFRQIFRVYAHIYHSHWVDPFWHIQNNSNPSTSGWTDLNSCFVHFVTVAKLFGLLSKKDLEPMEPLVEIWIANGSIPDEAARGTCAIATAPPLQQQQQQQQHQHQQHQPLPPPQQQQQLHQHS